MVLMVASLLCSHLKNLKRSCFRLRDRVEKKIILLIIRWRWLLIPKAYTNYYNLVSKLNNWHLNNVGDLIPQLLEAFAIKLHNKVDIHINSFLIQKVCIISNRSNVNDSNSLPWYQIVPGFRVRIIPVLGTIPAIFGQVMASYVVTQLAGLQVQMEPVVNFDLDHYRMLHQRLVEHEESLYGTAMEVQVWDLPLEMHWLVLSCCLD